MPDSPPLLIPKRKPDAHKGDFGRVLLFAGSVGMAGAAVLAGRAAVGGGAGLVTVATPRDAQPTVAAGCPCYMTLPLADSADEAAAGLVAFAGGCDVFAAGPGLHHAPDAVAVTAAVLRAHPRLAVVLDADALPALTGGRPGPARDWVVTPHPGEFARLLGTTAAAVQADRERLARDFAKSRNVVVLLKGHRTVVTDGERLVLNATGNPGMATGGAGDVLTGLVAALLGQGLSGFDAAALGAWVHGRAGDFCAADLGEVALSAEDVLRYLPRSLRLATAPH